MQKRPACAWFTSQRNAPLMFAFFSEIGGYRDIDEESCRPAEALLMLTETRTWDDVVC
jgi:hypothetical protein